jgi:probable F420-dependent oxidoreductase
MKIRIGIGLGVLDDTTIFDDVLDRLEEHDVDSLWLSEIVSSPAADPVIGLTYAAARTTRLKLGTGVSVLPGRNPVLFAKELASLAALAPGRILPSLGLGPAVPRDRAAYPVPAGRRGDVFDEALAVVRALLREPVVTFEGEFFSFQELSVGRLPTKPLDIWLGGSAPAALRRVGRLGDGWLASLVSPARAEAAISTITAAAAEAGRQIDDDHYGVSLPVAFGEVPAAIRATIARRDGEADADELVPVGWPATKETIARYVAAGVTKFVVRPATSPASWPEFIDQFAAEMLPLET